MSSSGITRFGEKLRALRLHRQMTLKSLAAALGLGTHSYLSELENGKKPPTAEFILSVARLFDVSTEALMKDEFNLDLERNDSA